MKTIYLKSILMLFFMISTTYAQVGVGTTAPTSTLDVVAANATGTSTTVDGLTVPRVTRQRAQSMTAANISASTMIYVNDISNGTATGITANVTAIGFYYWDGSIWIPVKTSKNTTTTTILNQYAPAYLLYQNEAMSIGGYYGFVSSAWTPTGTIQRGLLGGTSEGIYYAPVAANLTNVSLTGWLSNTGSGNGNATIHIVKYSLGTAASTYAANVTGTSLGSQTIAVASGAMSPINISVASTSLAAGDVLVCMLLNNSNAAAGRTYEFGGQLQFTN